MVTNGVRLDRIFDVAEKLDFIRIGLDSPDPAIYRTLHGLPESSNHFGKMIGNIATLVGKVGSQRVRVGYLVVPPHNHHRDSILRGAELAHGMGVDHIAYRPAYGTAGTSTEMWREAVEAILEAKSRYRPGFVLGGSSGSWPHVTGTQKHPTGVCRTRPLVLVVKADGTIPTCFLYRERLGERPAIGNIAQGFANVWYSDAHKESILSVDRSSCPDVCKLYRTERTLDSLEKMSPDEIPDLSDAELNDPHFI